MGFLNRHGIVCWVALCCAVQPLRAQTDFVAVDAYAAGLQIRDNDIEQLTDTLTAPFTTEMEKARAVFIWVAEHIAYDCGSENRLAAEPETAIDPLYYTQVQLNNILTTRRTRCEGFAFLFKLMCNLAEIQCSQVEGFARFAGEKVDPATVRPNHAWNAVCLDGAWHEVDVTAGAGQCEGRRFRRNKQDAYFLMADKLLERTYIPIDDGRLLINQGRIILKF